MAELADALASGSATTVFLSPPADFKQVKFHIFIFAGVAELADALASGSATTVFLSPPADFKQVKFHIFIFAGVAELADALASGASVRKDVWVQVPPSALTKAVMLRGNRGVLRFLL